MANNKYNETDILPLKHINKDPPFFYKSWGELDSIKKDYQEGKSTYKGTWPDWCFFPATLMQEDFIRASNRQYMDDKLKTMIADNLMNTSFYLTALHTWRHCKQVYIMDKELEEELITDLDLNAKIPTDILRHLPYSSLYIRFSHGPYLNCIKGVLINLTQGRINSSDPQVYDLFYATGLTESISTQFPILIPLDKKEVTPREIYRNCWSVTPEMVRESDGNAIEVMSAIATIMQIVLYCIADNVDRLPNLTQTTVYHRSNTVKDKYSECMQWDVGVRVGAALRKAKEGAATDEIRIVNVGTGTPKRPHIRRAHWTHYWTGPRNKPEERKLILKWIPPIAINADFGTDNTTVIHEIKE